MTPRERMIKTFEFGGPDRMPVVYHPSTAGLYVHGEKLLDLFKQYPPDNPIEFAGISKPDPTAIINGVYRETKRDEWGTLWEYAIFGVQGGVKECPLADLDYLESYEFPKLPDVQSLDAQREKENWICLQQNKD